jgi:Concanavalin A-like lectin/glucanases superfamily
MGLNRYALFVIATALFAAGLPATASAATATVALWHMDETSGAVMRDSSGHGNNGALHNVAVGQTSPHGKAYGFNGTSSYVKVADDPSLDPARAPVSVSLKVKFSQRPASNRDYDLLRKGLATTAGGDYKIEILDTGMAFCVFKGSAGTASLTRGPNLGNGRWHTIQCTKIDHSIKLVVDGTVYSRAVTVGSIANSSSVVIGAKPGDDYFKGLLDEVRVVVG